MPGRRGAPTRGRQSQRDPEQRGRRATINDVARLAQVSKKTVSRVINDSPFVHRKTREKIAGIIAELGFVPDPQARGLAFRHSFLIGLICDAPVPDNVAALLQGAIDALRGSGFELVIRACPHDDPNRLAQLRAFVESQRPFGVLLPPSLSQADQVMALLKSLDCPHARVSGGKPLRDAAFAAAGALVALRRPSAP